jgi:hypothetical protein
MKFLKTMSLLFSVSVWVCFFMSVLFC